VTRFRRGTRSTLGSTWAHVPSGALHVDLMPLLVRAGEIYGVNAKRERSRA
jgi:hypothetical protein